MKNTIRIIMWQIFPVIKHSFQADALVYSRMLFFQTRVAGTDFILFSVRRDILNGKEDNITPT
jgi:hypothetical protein